MAHYVGIFTGFEFRKNIKPSGYTWTTIDHRRVYSASLYEITSEHVSSVCLLLLFSRTSSAAALLRSCTETAVRGTWLVLVASTMTLRTWWLNAARIRNSLT